MNLPPKRLALLISLIGGGISPYAQARIDDHHVDLAKNLPGIACTELEAVALPVCVAPDGRDLVWQPQRSALDFSGAAGVLILYGRPVDDWAPGEAPGASPTGDTPRESNVRETIGSTPPGIAMAPAQAFEVARSPTTRESAHEPARKARRSRVFAKTAVAPVALTESRTEKLDTLALERIELLPQDTTLPQVSAGSLEVERLLANLAIVLGDSTASSHAEAARPGDPAIVDPEPSISQRMLAASAAQLERRPVEVETQADHVLRNLGAILSPERDEVGAIRTGASQRAAATHSDKVMAMLGQVSSAEPPLIEDGAARRLRKLAARAAKAQAVSHVAPAGVDVLLPLDPPGVAALPIDNFVRVPRTALQVPVPVPPLGTARRAKLFGDTQLAISAGALDRVRGGYAGEGLNVTFGIERAVYINGTLATTTSLNVTDLGQINAGRGAVGLDTGTIALIQSGTGNIVAGALIGSSAMGTIVQNTLDGQKIQNVTIINATANSLGVFRTMNLQSSLRGAVIDSLRR